MNLARTGTAAVVGMASAAAESPRLGSIPIVGQNVTYSTLVELLAVVAGGGMQYFSPYTVPNIVDGLVDGGIALLAKRGTERVLSQMASPMFAERIGGRFVAPALLPGGMGAYGQIGSIGGVPRRKLV